uniref:DUF3303 domain-containing protein n=1 Tax=Candidatus Methanophagaceae archaeon ANME-1 ERB6 TaxID=2759912 RepID=A0A7G9YZM1_9EURY|nr:hypothetical protein HCHKDHBN_00026 [Methanosarcinales archaeon ANME-1 ERB6]
MHQQSAEEGREISTLHRRKGGEKEKKMLFVAISTWEPEKRDEVDKRAAAMAKIPEGIKLIGSWVDLAGGRIFEVFEADDPKAVIEASFAWNDLCKAEFVSVMETEEAVKLIPKG